MNNRFVHQLVLAAVAGIVVAACGDNTTDSPPTTDPASTPIASISHDALYVVNGESNSLSVINTSTDEIAGTIALKNVLWPHHVYMSNDRSRLAVAVPGSDMSGGHGGGHHGGHGGQGTSMNGYIMVLDATTGGMVKWRKTDLPNHNAIYAPNGTEIWTAQTQTSGTVLVLDPITLETRQTIPVGNSPLEITFSSDGRYAFATNNVSDDVSVIDAATKQVVKTISVGDGPVGAWAGSNNVMYVDNEKGKTLTAIDAATLDTIRTYRLLFRPGMALVGPDNNLWVTDVHNGRVVLYSVDADSVVASIPTGAGAHAIAFHGNGTKAYITNQFADNVAVIDIASRVVTKKITVGVKPNGMVWRAK